MEDLLHGIEVELEPAQQRETCELLHKIIGNIVRHPGEVKFRTLKKDSKAFSEKVSRSPHAVSLLLAMGFEDCGDTYRCPTPCRCSSLCASGARLPSMQAAVVLLEVVLASFEAERLKVEGALEWRDHAERVEGVLEQKAILESVQAFPDVSEGSRASFRDVAAPLAAAPPPASAAPSSPPSSSLHPRTSKRLGEWEVRRREQVQQLSAVREARRVQFTGGAPAAEDIVGTWRYGTNSYTIATKDTGTWISQTLPNGVRLEAVLHFDARMWWQGSVSTTDGAPRGVIRVRRHGDKLLSNYKIPGAAEWGSPFIASKDAPLLTAAAPANERPAPLVSVNEQAPAPKQRSGPKIAFSFWVKVNSDFKSDPAWVKVNSDFESSSENSRRASEPLLDHRLMSARRQSV